MPTFYFPYRLKSEANIREHWTQKHKRHQKEREFLTLCMRNLNCKLPVIVSLYRIAPRNLDQDNLLSAFKNIRDTISDILIPGTYSVTFKKGRKKGTTSTSSNSRGKSDSDKRICWKYFQEKGKPKVYAVRIDIKEITQDEFDMQYSLRQIEEIIHDSKKIIDFPEDCLCDMSEQAKVAWFEAATAKLRKLKEIIEIPPMKIPFN